MFYIFLFYVFLLPLEYLQAKIPQGPTAVNYETIMMVILTGWLFLARPNSQNVRFTRTPLNIIFIIYMALIYLGMGLTYFQFPLHYLNVFNPNALAFKRVLYMFTCYLMFWLAANMVDSRKKLHYLLIAMVMSAPIIVRAFRNDLSGVSGWHYSDDMRVKGPFVHIGSNELGAFFVFGAIMFFFHVLQKIDWKERLLYLGGSMGYIYGVLYSYSRSTQLAFASAMALAAVVRHRWVIILFALAAVTTNIWLPQSVIDRWEMTQDEEGELDASAQSRKDYWKLAIDLFNQSPLIGQGVGTFPLINPTGQDTHNIYYRTLAEQGIVGFVVFMAIWFFVLQLSFNLWRKGTTPFDRNYGFALLTATVGLMLCNYFGDRFTHLAMIGQYWIFVGIGVRLYAHTTGAEPFAEEKLMPAERPDRETEGGGMMIPAPVPAGGLITARQLLIPFGRAQGMRRKLAEKFERSAPPRREMNVVGPVPLPAEPLKRKKVYEMQPMTVRQPAGGKARMNLVGRSTPPKHR